MILKGKGRASKYRLISEIARYRISSSFVPFDTQGAVLRSLDFRFSPNEPFSAGKHVCLFYKRNLWL